MKKHLLLFLFLSFLGSFVVQAQGVVPSGNVPVSIPLATPNSTITPNQTVTKSVQVPTKPVTVVLKPPPLVFGYQYPVRESFVYPMMPVGKYPDLDIRGFYEGKISGRNYNPKTPSDSRWLTIQQDPIYNKLPKNVMVGDPRLEIRYQFNIDGKLNKDLTVHYDIQQEPEFPGKYDVKVQYKNTKLTFFEFDTEFVDGDFTNVRKALNGVQLLHETEEWQTNVSLGKERSTPKKYEAFGTGTRKVSLGTRYILEDSVQVWVNQQPKHEHADYEVNYFEGEVTFKNIQSITDYVVIVYEFTNPIEEFIPALTRKNFMGAQYLWRSKPVVQESMLSQSFEEVLKPLGVTPNGEYWLKKGPVLLSSEIVKLNGRILNKNKDYYLKGIRKITFPHLELFKEDQLTIQYRAYLTVTVNDNLIGKNSQGPYLLSHKNILNETASVVVDGVVMRVGTDYTLEPDSGKLYFQYPIVYPTLIETQYVAIRTENTVATGSAASPLKMGVTYLNENINAQQDKIILSVPTESATLSPTTNIISTQYYPIVPSEQITVTVGGATIPTSDFSVYNAYLGQIKLLKAQSSTAATVKYSYKKSFKTNFVFRGKTGIQGGWYTNGFEFTLRDIPMKYKGLDRVELYTNNGELFLSEGQEYIVDYGQDGQSVRLQFKTASDPGYSASRLTTYPDDNARITMTYFYTPPDSPDQGNLSNSQFDISASKQLTDQWSVASEIALTYLSVSKPRSSGKFSSDGKGIANYAYQLGNSNLVENSEAVFVNGKRVNKDKDYIINYVSGTVKFVNLLPSSLDKILVTYDYFDPNGDANGATVQTWKPATKLATQFRTEDLILVGDYKYIDKDFSPLGDIKDPKGTSILGGSMEWRVDKLDILSFDYHRYDKRTGLNDRNEDVFFHTNDARGTAKINFYGLVDTVQTGRYLLEVEDPVSTTSTQNRHATDTLTIEYSGDAAVGPETFRNTVSRGYSKQIVDYLDAQNRIISTSERFRFGNQTKVNNVWALGESTFSPSFEYGKSQTDSSIASNNVMLPQTSYSDRKIYGFASTHVPLPALTGRIELNREEVRSKAQTQVTDNLNVLTNNNYSLGYSPFAWLSTGLNVNHHESESPLVNQKGEISDSRGYQISRLGPHGFFKTLGAEDTAFWMPPFRNSNLSYSRSETDRQENNYKRQYGSARNLYTFNNLELVEGVSMKVLSYEVQTAHNLNLEGNSTASQNSNSTDYSRNEAGFGIAPKVWFLNLFNYNLGFETRDNTAINEDLSHSATSNRVTGETPYFRRTQGLSFNPGDIIVPIPYLINMNFGRFSASIQESYEDKQNTTITEQFPTFNASNSHRVSISEDSSLIRNYILTSSWAPFNILTFSGGYTKNKEDLSRNINPSNIGTTFKDENIFQVSTSYSPLSFLSFNAGFQAGEVSQYRSPTINVSQSDIEQGLVQNNSAIATDFLYNRNESYTAGVTLTPFSFISIDGSGTYRQVFSQTEATQSYTTSTFRQKIGSTGVTLRPFITGLSMSYLYSLIFTDDGSGATSQGYSGVTAVTYTPVQTPGFNVSITYTRNDTWGFDLNTLDRALVRQGTGNDSAYQLIERDDTVELGVLSININLPITSSPFIDSVVVTGEGYVKRVTDHLDSTHDANNQHTYDISGMVIKGTINF